MKFWVRSLPGIRCATAVQKGILFFGLSGFPRVRREEISHLTVSVRWAGRGLWNVHDHVNYVMQIHT